MRRATRVLGARRAVQARSYYTRSFNFNATVDRAETPMGDGMRSSSSSSSSSSSNQQSSNTSDSAKVRDVGSQQYTGSAQASSFGTTGHGDVGKMAGSSMSSTSHSNNANADGGMAAAAAQVRGASSRTGSESIDGATPSYRGTGTNPSGFAAHTQGKASDGQTGSSPSEGYASSVGDSSKTSGATMGSQMGFGSGGTFNTSSTARSSGEGLSDSMSSLGESGKDFIVDQKATAYSDGSSTKGNSGKKN